MTLLAHEATKNPNKIDTQCWNNLSYNPNIFEYNYDAMRKHCHIYKEELMKNRFHPLNLDKFGDWGIDGF